MADTLCMERHLTAHMLVAYADPIDAAEAALRFRVVEVNGERLVMRVTADTFPAWSPELLPTECVSVMAVVPVTE